MLYCNPAIYLDKSEIHGWGVFTREPINDGDLIQEAPYLLFADDICNDRSTSILKRYVYAHNNNLAHGLGFSCLYNHSQENRNVGWSFDIPERVIIHRAIRDIEAGEELLINYGYEPQLTEAIGSRMRER